jgi:hypothetical protein
VTSISKTQLVIVLCSLTSSTVACSGLASLDEGSIQNAAQPGNHLNVADSPSSAAANPAPQLNGTMTFAPSAGHGSFAGVVLDADTGSPLSSMQVTAVGVCNGTGCTDATSATQITDSSGAYIFDVDGTVNGEDAVQDVTAASGQDAVVFNFTSSDGSYAPITVFFHPNFSTTDPNPDATLPTFYLCSAGATDSDGDGICDAAEALYGTDPQQPDSDFDAFSDSAELFGLDGVDLRYYGASATHADVFVYIDFYSAPSEGVLTGPKAAFDVAPIVNFDESTGIHLNLLSSGKPIASDAQNQNIIISKTDSMGMDYEDWSDFDAIKTPSFPSALTRIAHYALFANQFDSDDWSGFSRGISAHDFLVTLPGGTELAQAGTFMHELGHNLGLQHGGNEETNYKPNYISIMSYTYQFYGLYVDGHDGVLDYSRVSIDGLDEAVLCETTDQNPVCATSGMAPLAPTTAADLSHYGAKFPYAAGQNQNAPSVLVMGTCNGPLDFNNNQEYDKGTVNVDLDGFARGPENTIAEYQSTVFNSSWNDWVNINYYGDGTEGGGWIGDMVTAGFGPIRVVASPQTVAPSDMPKELRYP